MRRFLLACSLLLPVSAANLHAQDWAKARLEKSPRHREYISLKTSGGPVQAFVVYPEIKDKAPVVVLIHEIFGLSDWMKTMADDLAASGYIVVAPDLLTGKGPSGGNTDSFATRDEVTKAVSTLSPDAVTEGLNAAVAYAKTIPAGNGKIAVGGFCWGGGQTFRFATNNHDISAAYVFYGPPPAADDMKKITVPVYGFYAGNDARIDATIPATIETMKAAGKTYEPVTYDGAGHGFMRAGVDPADTNPNNKKAREDGYARLTTLLKSLSGTKKSAVESTPNRSMVAKAAKGSKAKKAAPATMECHDMSTM